MSFFQKIGNAIVRFMYGRNGMDQMNRALFWGYIAVFFGQVVFSALRLQTPALICEIVLWPLMVLILSGGLLLTVRLGLLQMRRLPLALRWMVKNEEGGDGEITDAMYDEVKRFAAFIKQREADRNKE